MYKSPLSLTAEVFWSGGSQAVRLPEEFRVDTHRLRIVRDGDRIVLEPLSEALDAQGWPPSFWSIFGKIDDSFKLGERWVTAERSDLLEDIE